MLSFFLPSIYSLRTEVLLFNHFLVVNIETFIYQFCITIHGVFMNKDIALGGIIFTSMLLVVVGALLVISEISEYKENQLLAGYSIPIFTEQEVLAASWDQITAGTTVTYIRTITPEEQLQEEPSEEIIIQPVEEVIEEEPVSVELNAVEQLLEDIEDAFNSIDNLDDELSDIRSSIQTADDENDLEDLEEELDDLEDSDFEELEDFVFEIDDRFEDIDQDDFDTYTKEEFEDIEEKIDNAKENLQDLEDEISEANDLLNQRYSEV